MTDSIEAALNPALGLTRSRERPLTPRELMQRDKAVCAANPVSSKPSCTGVIFVGMFFDGTGNNEDADFKKPERSPREQKHSNVVRLYHAFPGQDEGEHTSGTTSYYRYYIPGVGTPFEEIGDDGKGIDGQISQTLGSTSAWYGEPRIIWGLTRIFNAVSRYAYKSNIFDNKAAASLARNLSGVTSFGSERRKVLKDTWQAKLKSQLVNRKPEITQINLSVFGFSRGAAEARAFVNWLCEICEHKDGGYLFAGIPLRVQFLGIFDTVASVGAAGLYSVFEGRQSWAWNNMQVHPAVEQCLHLVAGHEVRACFPLDSVRIDGRYPPNVREYVYPGSHSDVGGGYMPMCLGKNDWAEDDRQLARIPGFEMYCAAMIAGVPFTPLEKLREPVAKALVPHPRHPRSLPRLLQGRGHHARPRGGDAPPAHGPLFHLPLAVAGPWVAGLAGMGAREPASQQGQELRRRAAVAAGHAARADPCDCGGAGRNRPPHRKRQQPLELEQGRAAEAAAGLRPGRSVAEPGGDPR
ncbi:T6SS phospholipase effector Tle1-like catalytic domain-containing protein [Variovorax beijingensis]|uniref:T6SS phospholipase effector Tle1-like catalytic domain-containing protein n=1 Tax=Variovorax beijingensis TaxID=2496117 RepID=UPI0011A0FD99|nr:DUF2235 domain-containing protein [Variovorax beijingensis]